MDGRSQRIERSHRRHVLGVEPRLARMLTLGLGALVVLVLAMDVGLAGFSAGLGLAALPVPVYVSLALWLDRFEAEPGPVLLRAFLWGAIVAMIVSLLANQAAFAMLAGLFGADAGDLLSGVLAAPAIEEVAKGAALLLLFVHHDDEFDNVTDGVVYAAMVGLGFAMTENALYYGRVWNTTSLSTVFVLRGVLGPFAHPLFTAMTGVGIGLARERHGARGSWSAPAIGFALAVLLHAVWNAAASAQLLFPATYFVVMVPAFLAALVVCVRSTRREVMILRRHLRPFVDDGVIPAAEVRTVCTLRGRMRALLRALRAGGLHGLGRRRRFHDDVTHLAFQAWRLERGIDAGPEGVARVRAYEARVRAWAAGPPAEASPQPDTVSGRPVDAAPS